MHGFHLTQIFEQGQNRISWGSYYHLREYCLLLGPCVWPEGVNACGGRAILELPLQLYVASYSSLVMLLLLYLHIYDNEILLEVQEIEKTVKMWHCVKGFCITCQIWRSPSFCLTCIHISISSLLLECSIPRVSLNSCVEALQWAESQSWTHLNLVLNVGLVFLPLSRVHLVLVPKIIKLKFQSMLILLNKEQN